MKIMFAWLLVALTRVRDDGDRRDRGDVPGWVMVTVETVSEHTRVLSRLVSRR